MADNGGGKELTGRGHGKWRGEGAETKEKIPTFTKGVLGRPQNGSGETACKEDGGPGEKPVVLVAAQENVCEERRRRNSMGPERREGQE